MEFGEPAPIPLNDHALQALGAIAVQSARLEWFLVGLHALLDESSLPHREYLREGRAKEHVKAIRRHLADADESGPLEETVRWAEEAARLLGLRGDVMHSSWVVNTGGTLTTSHMRSGQERPFDQAELDDLALALGVHVAMAPAYWAFAVLWAEQRDAGGGGSTR